MHTYCFKILFLSERVASVVDLLNFVLILCPMIILIMRRTTMPQNFLSLIVVWNLWFIANAFPFVFFGVQSWKTIRYVHEQGIMKYIKIAASLPNKTVRDVAMRCQWVGKKVNTRRRKPQEHHTGRNIKERQDKFVETALWGANHPLQTGMRTNSFVPPNVQNNLFIPGGW